jgi:hypothetical protein
VLVYNQHAFIIGGGRRIFEQEFETALISLSRLPPGLRKEPLQAPRFPSLRSGHGLGVSKRGQGLVALRREQKPLQVTPKAVALGASAEEIIEASGIPFQRTGSGLYGQSSGHGGTSLPPLKHPL